MDLDKMVRLMGIDKIVDVMVVRLTAIPGTLSGLVFHSTCRSSSFRAASIKVDAQRCRHFFKYCVFGADENLVEHSGFATRMRNIKDHRSTIDENKILVRNPCTSQQHGNDCDFLQGFL